MKKILALLVLGIIGGFLKLGDGTTNETGIQDNFGLNEAHADVPGSGAGSDGTGDGGGGGGDA